MRYKGFYITIHLGKVIRKDEDGNTVSCDGFSIEIFADEAQYLKIDSFDAAAGIELLENTVSEVEQLVKDYISTEMSALSRLANEALAE